MSLSRIVMEVDGYTLNQLITKGLVRLTTPLFLDTSWDVREAATGALR